VVPIKIFDKLLSRFFKGTKDRSWIPQLREISNAV